MTDAPAAADTREVRIVLCTMPSEEVAAKLGRGAVERRLAACATLIPGVRSIYVWKDEVCDEPEVQVLFKTTAGRAQALVAWLDESHPYDVPELLTLRPEAASAAYGGWVAEQTEAPDTRTEATP